MKKLFVLLILALFGLQGFASDTSSKYVKMPQAFKTIIASERKKCNNRYSYGASYLLYDITGDGIAELWIKAGDCEADTSIKVYKLSNGKAKLIYDGEAGHSDQIIYNNRLVTVVCQQGAGYVITYKYKGNRITDSYVEFDSGIDGEDEYSSSDPETNKILDYWDQEGYTQNLFTIIE